MNTELEKFGKGQNMLALDYEVQLLESLNYTVDSIVGYGEGVFMVSVKMVHDIYPMIIVGVAQSHEDSTHGVVEVRGYSRLIGEGYEFSTRGHRGA